MKYLILLFIIILQTSCSELRFTKKHNGIDPEIKPYIDEFIYASRGKITEEDLKGLSIGFYDYENESSTVGTCHLLVKDTEIDISKKWWDNNVSYISRQGIIFHELGHCVFKKNHTEEVSNSGGFFGWWEKLFFKLGIYKEKNKLPDGCPSSIMHPYIIDEICLSNHYLYYLEELFTGLSYKDFLSKNYKFAMNCKAPKIINDTNTWTKLDEDTVKRAGKTCIKKYQLCLKRFIKTEELTYNAICGN